MAKIVLRDYQQAIVRETRELMLQGYKKILIQLPTGGGKTALASDMIGTAVGKGRRCWFICNRVELVEQTARAQMGFDIPFGVISAGYNQDYRQKSQICSIQTLSRRLENIPAQYHPDLIFWDETRGIAAKTWKNVYLNFPNAYHIGLDATPHRLSGEPLREYYEVMVKGPTVRQLMDAGHLCDYKYFGLPKLDFSNVRTKMGEYVIEDLDAVMNNKKIIGNAISEYKKHAMGMRNLVFCNSIAHSIHTRDEFLAAGIKAEHIDGCTDKVTRAQAIKRFERGETLVLTSVDLVTAGFDVPAIQVVTISRRTRSLAMAKQIVGRGLRTHKDKDKLIIIDQVNAYEDHGFPDDDIEWSLDSHKKKPPKNNSDRPLYECPKCYFKDFGIFRKCPECGTEHVVKSREEDFVSTSDELAQLNPKEIQAEIERAAQMSAKKEQGQAKSLQELIEVGKKRGYKKAERWAHHIMQARQRKKLGY